MTLPTLGGTDQPISAEEGFELIAREIEKRLGQETALWATALRVKLRAGGLGILTRGLGDFSIPISLSALDFDDMEQSLVVAANFTLTRALETGMDVITDHPGILTIGRPDIADLMFRSAFIPAPTHPRAIAWIETKALFLVNDLSAQSRLGVRETLSRAIASGTNPNVAARQIARSGVLGLNRRQAIAVDNFRNALIRAGVRPGIIDDRVTAYATRTLRHRATVIARTEMLSAANQSLRQSWRQMADVGLLDPVTTELVWITATDDRVCEQCWPMEGVVVGFEQVFTSNTLGLPGDIPRPRREAVVTDTPPLHPQCRCTIGIR